ncbi:MAG: nucleotidyltransferase family protein [Pseudomonadota bacterium]
MIPIIILAAGASKRMRGQDKLLEDVEGVPLLRRQAQMALATGCDVIIALPSRPHPRYDAVDDLAVQCLPVADAAEGMNASLRTALGAVPEAAEGAMILLGDLPELTVDDLRTVFQSVDFYDDTLIWRGATSDGRAGHPVVIARPAFAELMELTGDAGAQPVLARYQDRIQLVPLPGQHARRDLDTPEEWAAWRDENP